MSQGNKKIKARKVPATKEEFFIPTSSLIQPAPFKKYRQPIIKFWRYTRQFVYYLTGEDLMISESILNDVTY